MIQQYLPLLILLIVSVALGFIVVGLGHLFGPHRPTSRKSAPYESGMVPYGTAMHRISVRYYLVAIPADHFAKGHEPLAGWRFSHPALRWTVLVLLVVALASPVLRLHGRGGVLVVVADRSESMPPDAIQKAIAAIPKPPGPATVETPAKPELPPPLQPNVKLNNSAPHIKKSNLIRVFFISKAPFIL